MQKILRIAVIVFYIFIISYNGSAQKSTAVIAAMADSSATGNYKDAFKNFFQLAFDRFTSENKELQFTSNPYAVMAKLNPELLVDTNYIKYRHLRNLNFSFSGKLDSSFKFNGFSSGIKYALINKRDETVSSAFIDLARNSNKERDTLNNRLNAYISTIPVSERGGTRAQVNKVFKGELELGQLDTSLQTAFKKFTEDLSIKFDAKLNIGELSKKSYDSLKYLFNNKLLWTVGINDTTYNDEFLFSNIVISSELVKGIVNPTSVCNLEINVKTTLQYTNDTLQSGRDLKRSVFNLEPGLNFVLMAKGSNKSFLEFKLSGSYNHVFSTLYKDEERDRLMINSTLRIRILNDIWIPFEIKYDPKSGNALGFLNVRANFTALRSLLKG